MWNEVYVSPSGRSNEPVTLIVVQVLGSRCKELGIQALSRSKGGAVSAGSRPKGTEEGAAGDKVSVSKSKSGSGTPSVKSTATDGSLGSGITSDKGVVSNTSAQYAPQYSASDSSLSPVSTLGQGLPVAAASSQAQPHSKSSDAPPDIDGFLASFGARSSGPLEPPGQQQRYGFTDAPPSVPTLHTTASSPSLSTAAHPEGALQSSSSLSSSSTPSLNPLSKSQSAGNRGIPLLSPPRPPPSPQRRHLKFRYRRHRDKFK